MAEHSIPRQHPRFRHGYAPYRRETRTYKIWSGMLQRCTNPNNPAYHRYSALGVCDRWRKFEEFLADMGEAPPGMTLDRIDNERGYSPENCRWATVKDQQRNRADNLLLTFEGKTQCVSAWAQALGIGSSTILYRIHKGWPVDRALTTPVRRPGAAHCVNGHEYTPENTYLNKKGYRFCRRCHAITERNRRRKVTGLTR